MLPRFSDSRIPIVGTGPRLELRVRELTPIQPISDDSRPYSIFGQRFMMTVMPAASAFAAASSWRTPSCSQITFGSVGKARIFVEHRHDVLGAAEDIDHVDGSANLAQ